MKAIRTKPISATRSNPFRIQAQDYSGNKLLIPYNEDLSIESNHLIAAERFVSHLGLKGFVCGAPVDLGHIMWILHDHIVEEELYFEVK